jgi:hypothetical protein
MKKYASVLCNAICYADIELRLSLVKTQNVIIQKPKLCYNLADMADAVCYSRVVLFESRPSQDLVRFLNALRGIRRKQLLDDLHET